MVFRDENTMVKPNLLAQWERIRTICKTKRKVVICCSRPIKSYSAPKRVHSRVIIIVPICKKRGSPLPFHRASSLLMTCPFSGHGNLLLVLMRLETEDLPLSLAFFFISSSLPSGGTVDNSNIKTLSFKVP